MIKFRFPEEKEALHHYAKTLNNTKIEAILQSDEIKTSDDARELQAFSGK